MKQNPLYWILAIILILLAFNSYHRTALFEDVNLYMDLWEGQTYTLGDKAITNIDVKINPRWDCWEPASSYWTSPNLANGWVMNEQGTCIFRSSFDTGREQGVGYINFDFDGNHYQAQDFTDPRPNAQTLYGYYPNKAEVNGIIFSLCGLHFGWAKYPPSGWNGWEGSSNINTNLFAQEQAARLCYTINNSALILTLSETPTQLPEKEIYKLPIKIENNIVNNLNILLGIQHSFTTPFGIQKSTILLENFTLVKGTNNIEITIPTSVPGNASTEIQPIIQIFGANYTKTQALKLDYTIVTEGLEPDVIYETLACSQDSDCPSDAFCDKVYGLCIKEIYKDNNYYTEITCEDIGCPSDETCYHDVCVTESTSYVTQQQIPSYVWVIITVLGAITLYLIMRKKK